MEWLLLAIAILLTLGTALFVAAEFSLIAVNRASIEQEAEAGNKSSIRVLNSLRTLSTQLSAAQVGITFTTLIVGYLAEPSVAQLINGPLADLGLSENAAQAVAVAVAIIFATALQMIFGELVPKNLAIARPSQTAKAVAPAMHVFILSTGGFIRLLNKSANAVLRMLHVEPQEELRSARSADEIGLLVTRSGEEGTLEAHTANLLSRTLAFGDRTAVDVMTPATRMQTVSATDTVMEVLRAVNVRGHSRFPVIGEDRDDVVGVVHVKHAVAVPVEQRDTKTIGEIMVEPVVIPGSAPLDPLLTNLRDKGLQMAIVIDEYGGTDGIVTLEDLVEELVGDITDEFDRPGAHARRKRDGSWSIAASLRPDEIAELTTVNVPESEEYDTVGGLIFDQLGRLPENGDTAVITATVGPDEILHHVMFTVERMDGLRIDRVQLAVDGIVEVEEVEQ